MKTPLALSALVAAAASTATTAAVPNGKVRGMTYAPMLHSTSNMLWDDAMTTGGQVWWGDGSQNRGDLSTMSQMGVETVRLYGLAPGSDHSVFLGVAQSHNLKVFPGTSDYPLTQAPTNCLSAPDQCYSVLLASFNSLLSPQTGFTQGSGWNPQISMYNLVNEPELKFHGWQTTAKVVVTLLDALLQAEQANGITGYKPTLTIAVSTATTDAYDPNSYCLQRGFVQSGDCSVAVMCDVYEAISSPSLVGYTPVSSQADLSAALAQRFAWGFNSDLDAPATQALVVTPYTKLPFSSQALYITEYHGFPVAGLPDRMQALYAIPQISGIFFHEFETSYWKGGSEENYGAFADGSTVVGNCVGPNCKGTQPVYCLQQTDVNGNVVGPLVAGVYGGSAPTNSWNGFCAASSLRGNLRNSILAKVNNNKDNKEDKSAAPHNN